MKDRGLVVLVWLLVVGVLGAVIVAIASVVLLVLRAEDDAAVPPSVTMEPADDQDQRRDADGTDRDADGAPGGGDAGSPGAGDGSRASGCEPPAKPGPLERLVLLADDEHRLVDGLDLYPRAKAMAHELEPASELRYISAKRVNRGRIDLGADEILYVFEYQRRMPHGTDTGLVEVRAACFGLHAKLRRGVKIYRHNQYDPLPDPRCTTGTVWRAAVASGVPQDKTIALSYRDDDYMVRGSPAVWSVTIDDEPQHRREVDGQRCAVIRTYESGAPVMVPDGPGAASADAAPAQSAPPGTTAAPPSP